MVSRLGPALEGLPQPAASTRPQPRRRVLKGSVSCHSLLIAYSDGRGSQKQASPDPSTRSGDANRPRVTACEFHPFPPIRYFILSYSTSDPQTRPHNPVARIRRPRAGLGPAAEADLQHSDTLNPWAGRSVSACLMETEWASVLRSDGLLPGTEACAHPRSSQVVWIPSLANTSTHASSPLRQQAGPCKHRGGVVDRYRARLQPHWTAGLVVRHLGEGSRWNGARR